MAFLQVFFKIIFSLLDILNESLSGSRGGLYFEYVASPTEPSSNNLLQTASDYTCTGFSLHADPYKSVKLAA